MGILTRLGFRRPPATPAEPTSHPDRVETFTFAPGSGPWLPGGQYVGTGGFAGRVSRAEAISVPAIKRGRDLICSLAALGLHQLDPARRETPNQLLNQIDPNTSNVVTLAQTFDDLLFHAVSWWEILAFDSAGFPSSARHLNFESVSMSPPAGMSIQTLPSGLFPAGVVWVMGQPIDGRRAIRFDSPNDPILTAGARAIRRALKLAQTSEMYADDPEARAYWVPVGDTDPGDRDTITAHLSAYAAARRSGAEAYIPAAIDRKLPNAPSAVDIQLAQLQQRSDIECANVIGIDPEDIGVSTTSRTYANITDRRTDRINNLLASYIQAVVGRLSLNDVTRRGYRIEFELDDYLKADPATRWATYATAVDKQIMSVPEIRDREDLPEIPVAPARRPAPAPTVGAPID